MTQAKDCTVWFQVLDGVWEAAGSDRSTGTWPEGVTLTADGWGPSKASFSLHRDPLATWPDIAAYTPIKIEVGGVLVWSGRVSETPTSQDNHVISVQCEGWQYHLDDDVYERVYVHARLSDYKDLRGMPGVTLGAASLNAAAQVTADGNMIYLGWPTGTQLVPGATAGVVLDLGPNSTAQRVVAEWESSNNAPDFLQICRGSSVAAGGTGFNDAFSFSNSSGSASSATAGTLATMRRYVAFLLFNSTFTGTTGADVFWKIKAARVFADTAYQVSEVSVLKATTIIPDALTRATLLLSPDRSLIDPAGTVTFAFPEFALEGQKTPREVMSAANAAHDYMLKVDPQRRVIFKPRPSAAAIEIGEWPGSSFEDASANSGEEIYNRVVVEGTGSDGERLSVEQTAAQGVGVVGEPIASPAPDNPSFVTNTTSWTASSGTTITRDTVTFDTTPASGRWDRGVGVSLQHGDQLTETFTGTFRAGVAYTLTFWLRADGTSTGTTLKVIFGNAAGTDRAPSQTITLNASTSQATTVSVTWTPTADQTTGQLLLFRSPGGGISGATSWYRVDSLALTISRPTLIDRRGFRRTHILPVKASLTDVLATQIATVWLEAHKTTPLKGTVRIEGDQATRDITTGASVPPELLLLRTGELLRLSDRVDPDTGGQGRNGRIAEVTYSVLDNVATVALDSRRTSHEALLERLAVVVGSG